MPVRKSAIILSVFMAVVFAASLLHFTTAFGCSPIPSPKDPVMGSQGFRIWAGPTVTSFEHENKKICIPKDWEALGEKSSGAGWAFFESGMTGVAVKTAEFEEKKLAFSKSSYEVRLVYPKDTPAAELELYEATTRNAFEKIGALFNDSKDGTKRRHTVLVTPGIPRPDGKKTPIYPDPRANLSIYVQSPESVRGEELMIHAVAHLYNRERPDLSAYQKNQPPFPEADFQELEASWSELAYRMSDKGRNARIEYLYNIHSAVQTNNFSLVTTYPFNESEAEFKNIQKSVIVSPDASFLTAQYGHYILGPLAMAATEGMLKKKGADADIEKILARVHAEKTSYFEALAEHLSSEEIKEIRSWMFEGKTVPYELVRTGVDAYNTR